MNLHLAPPRVQRSALRLAAVLAVLTATLATSSTVAVADPTPGSSPTATGTSSPSSGDDGAVPPKNNATFGIQPVTNGRIDSRAAFTYQTGPGGAYQDDFAVVNYGAQPLTLQIYAADLTNNSDGGLVVGSAADKKDGAAAWIRLPTGLTSVTLPGATAETGPGLTRIPFAWAVPISAAAGDHTAAIVASLSVTSTGKDGNPVRLDQRIAARVFFRVSGTITPRLSVSDFTVAYSGTWNPVGSGSAEVSYTLTNTGNVRLGAQQRLSSSAWLGAGGTPDAIPDQPQLLPGGSVHVTATVRHVFPGFKLTEKLHIDPVRAVDDVNVTPKAVDVETYTWAIPWPLILCILALLMVLGLAFWWWRRRRKRRPESRHGARRGGGGPGPSGGGGGPAPDDTPTPDDVPSATSGATL